MNSIITKVIEKQKLKKSIRTGGFFIATLILLVLLFFILSPKLSSTLFSVKRQLMLKSYIAQIQKNDDSPSINPQEYWEFREFYSPGYFDFEKKGFTKPIQKNTLRTLNFDVELLASDSAFLIFHSSKLQSIDILTSKDNLFEILIVPKEAVILNKTSDQIVYRMNNLLKVAFLKTAAEMKTANGFFDYNDKDKGIADNKFWLNLTSISED